MRCEVCKREVEKVTTRMVCDDCVRSSSIPSTDLLVLLDNMWREIDRLTDYLPATDTKREWANSLIKQARNYIADNAADLRGKERNDKAGTKNKAKIY